MREVLYTHEDVVASFPYTFELVKEDDGTVKGYVRAFLYSELQLNGNEEDVKKKLSDISCIEGCAFILEGDCINYTTSRAFEEVPPFRHAEVATRRSFIEDYIEAANDLQAIGDEYHAKFLKTEFVY